MEELRVLDPFEKSVMDAVITNNLRNVKRVLHDYKGKPNFRDESGLTALHHAAHMGNVEMVKYLLDMGADLGSYNYKYDYSSLHFAALSGNVQVVKMLLEAGVKPTATTSVGRSAAQMAGFCGHYEISEVIKNYVQRAKIAHYSIPQKDQKEALIPAYLVDSIHQFVLVLNVHPVKIAYNLKLIPFLYENIEKVTKVLQLMCKREMARGQDTREALAFKFHYLSFVAKDFRDKKRAGADDDDRKHDIFEMFAKKLLKPGKDGYTLETMESFLKDCVREFPLRQSTTFQDMYELLSKKDPPPALSIINSIVLGMHRLVDTEPFCATCGDAKPMKKCIKCKEVNYCDRECQRVHWFVHKKGCHRIMTGPMNI